jgi:hypothetical protein
MNVCWINGARRLVERSHECKEVMSPTALSALFPTATNGEGLTTTEVASQRLIEPSPRVEGFDGFGLMSGSTGRASSKRQRRRLSGEPRASAQIESALGRAL